MFIIKKNKEPDSLTLHRAKAHSTYDNADIKVKNDIRSALLLEQGHVCAYCMDRISFDNMKIEHWACQASKGTKHLQLTYSNLLGCCMGGHGKRYKSQTCDTRKGDKKILYSPSAPKDNIDLKIKFLANGEISSDIPDFKEQINDVLNLNFSRLVSNRYAVITSIQKVLHKNKATVTKAKLTNLITHVSMRNVDKKLTPFFEVKVKYLQKKLASLPV
jgi:uncharacterized protein (TIGR02646 family)